MYLCMHACMYLYMHACMHACMYVCMYVCMHACMHVCMYVYVCMCVCTYVCGSVGRHAGRQAGMHARMYVWVYINIDIYTVGCRVITRPTIACYSTKYCSNWVKTLKIKDWTHKSHHKPRLGELLCVCCENKSVWMAPHCTYETTCICLDS